MHSNDTHKAGMAIYQILSDFDDIRRKVLRNAPMSSQKKLYGLTLRQSAAVSQVMMLTNDYPEGISLKQLSEQMVMKASAASILVEKMVGKGILERVENPNDRHSIRIRISPAGRELIQSTQQLLSSEMERFASILSIEEQEQLARITTKLKKHASQEQR